MDEDGIALSLNIQIDSKDVAAYKKLTAQIDEIDSALKNLDADSEEYNNLSKQRQNKLQQLIQASQNLIDSDQSQLHALIGTGKDLTQEDQDAILTAFDIVNGKVIDNAENIAKLTDKQLAGYKAIKNQLEDYAETQKEYSDAAIENAQKLAQTQIDEIVKVKQAEIDALTARKEALEKYFDEVDALDEETDRATQKDSLVTQIAALTGALDGSSKSKIKELQQELRQLQEEELQAQKQNQRDALLNSIETMIRTLNNDIGDLNDSLGKYTQAILRGIGYEAPKYAQGGLVNYTGPAWVDGTPTNPEAFLSATDVRLIQDLVSSLRLSPVENSNSNINIDRIDIHTDHLDNNQDFANAGETLADAFSNAIRRRGINTNARK